MKNVSVQLCTASDFTARQDPTQKNVMEALLMANAEVSVTDRA
jgi:hypothetical protein